MAQHTLRPEEVEALRVVLSAVTIDRHGEIGVLHGPDRLVTSRHGLTPVHVDALNSLARTWECRPDFAAVDSRSEARASALPGRRRQHPLSAAGFNDERRRAVRSDAGSSAADPTARPAHAGRTTNQRPRPLSEPVGGGRPPLDQGLRRPARHRQPHRASRRRSRTPPTSAFRPRSSRAARKPPGGKLHGASGEQEPRWQSPTLFGPGSQLTARPGCWVEAGREAARNRSGRQESQWSACAPSRRIHRGAWGANAREARTAADAYCCCERAVSAPTRRSASYRSVADGWVRFLEENHGA